MGAKTPRFAPAMLRYSTKPSRAPVGTLSPDEDLKLRQAFGCAAEARYRAAGEKVVAIHYEQGRWLLCDCRPDAQRPPTLFLVSASHIQREDMGDGTPHADDCVFARDDREQRELIETYRRKPKNERQFRLINGFSDADKQPSRPKLFASPHEKRDELARVLYELLHEAMLDRVLAGEALYGGIEKRAHSNQLLMKAAESFFLTKNRPISDWLATNLDDYKILQNRLKAKPTGWNRPHGLFIDVFYTIKDKGLYLKSGKLLATVTGPFPVFGEQEALIRPPYLVIGLLAHPRRDSDQVELLRAYAHPCVAWDRLLLVDSNLERKTLNLLMECREWLVKKHQLTFAITKPLFDANLDHTDEAREICKPDFVIRPQSNTAKNPAIVIETMGYNTHAYRERKLRLRPLFERIGNGPQPAPVIEHDYFVPDQTAEEVDRQFFRKVCAAVMAKK